MSDLSAETRALLDRARGGEALPTARRTALRRRIGGALGVAAPLAFGGVAAASVSVGTWAVRGLAVLGTAGVVGMAVLAPAPAVFRNRLSPPVHVETVDRVGGVHAAGHGHSSGLRAESTTTTPAPEAPSEVTPEPAEPPPPASASPHPEAPRPATSWHASRPAPERAEDALTAEVRLLGDARDALAEGDAARALEVLTMYGRRFTAGALAPEAAVLRVDALCAAGRAAEAEAEVRRFAALDPSSPLTRRFASTCARGAASAIAR
jgi:hypothetical protein